MPLFLRTKITCGHMISHILIDTFHNKKRLQCNQKVLKHYHLHSKFPIWNENFKHTTTLSPHHVPFQSLPEFKTQTNLEVQSVCWQNQTKFPKWLGGESIQHYFGGNCLDVYLTKVVMKNFALFTGKCLQWSSSKCFSSGPTVRNQKLNVQIPF